MILWKTPIIYPINPHDIYIYIHISQRYSLTTSAWRDLLESPGWIPATPQAASLVCNLGEVSAAWPGWGGAQACWMVFVRENGPKYGTRDIPRNWPEIKPWYGYG